MMGLKPSRPGWDEFVFAPMIPDDLAEASVTLTTPKGKVSAKFKQTETTVVYELVVPEGSLARLSLLEAPVTISVDNKTYTVDGKKTAFGKINRVVPVQLHAGKHIIRIEKE